MKIWFSFKIDLGSGGSEILKIFAVSAATAVFFSKDRRLSRSAYISNCMQERKSGTRAEGGVILVFLFRCPKNELSRSRKGVTFFFYFDEQKNEIFKSRGVRNAPRVSPPYLRS
jgi:hypothetical protein